MKKEEYLRILTEQIRCKMARPGIEEEIRRHIEDQQEAYLCEGMNVREAEEAAVTEMGDPAETGIWLDQVHRPGMDWAAVVLISFLYLLGIVFRNLLQIQYGDAVFQMGGWIEDTAWTLLGIAVMIGVCYIDYSRFVRYAKAGYLGLFFLLLIGVTWFAIPVNGSASYIGSYILNGKMLVYLFAPLYGGLVFHYYRKGIPGIFKCILWMFPPIFICFRMASVITMCSLYLTFAFVLLLAIYQEWFQVKIKTAIAGVFAALVGIPAVVIGVLAFAAGGLPAYQAERLGVYLDPMSTETGTWLDSFRNALLQSSWLGHNRAEWETEKYLYGGSDYILSYLIISFGILIGLLVCGMIIFLFFRLLRVSICQKNRAGSLMGAGCAFFYLIQFLLFVMMNLGLLPGTSIYCPFLTYGKSGLLITSIMLGILLSIYRYREIPLALERKTLSSKVFKNQSEKKQA